MLQTIGAPSFEQLVAEQEVVQANKFQGRLLAEYSDYVFPGQNWRKPLSSAVTDFLQPLSSSGKRLSLGKLVHGLHESNGGEPVQWVDMGGGRGLAMRQLASNPKKRARLAMTNVDLFDYGLAGLEADELTYIEGLAPGATHEAAAPNFIRADVETVQFPKPAHLITSVEAIQYINNPLAAISNWYNQLASNGLLVVSAEHNWSRWIRYDRDITDPDRDITPTVHFLQELGAKGISFAATYKCDEGNFRPKLDPKEFTIFAIQKRARTSLVVNASVAKIWANSDGYKAAYYEPPFPASRPTVEVVDTNSLSAT